MSATCAATNASRISREPRLSLEPRAPNMWTRPAYNDGRTPKSSPLRTEIAIAKHSTRPSRIAYACEAIGAGWTFAAMEVVQNATKTPAREAASATSTHSVSNCCEMRARLAPRADRMENSVARSAVRAINRFATFMQAIARISATQAISSSEAFLVGPASSSWSAIMRKGYFTVSVGGAVGPKPVGEPIGIRGKCRAGLRPRDARLQPRDRFPAVVARAEGCRLPKNGLARVIEPRWRDTNDGKRVSI